MNHLYVYSGAKVASDKMLDSFKKAKRLLKGKLTCSIPRCCITHEKDGETCNYYFIPPDLRRIMRMRFDRIVLFATVNVQFYDALLSITNAPIDHYPPIIPLLDIPTEVKKHASKP